MNIVGYMAVIVIAFVVSLPFMLGIGHFLDAVCEIATVLKNELRDNWGD